MLTNKKLKILKVIHGFPPDFMAGSEVYSFTLCKELAKMGHKVFVFTRVENEFSKPYEVYDEVYNGRDFVALQDAKEKAQIESFSIRRINKPKDYIYGDKFYDTRLESAFKEYLQEIHPDIVHFGHIAHLSIRLVNIAKECGKKVIFTLHDFWLYCVRGQLIDSSLNLCSAPSVEKCKACSPYKPKDFEVKEALENLKKVREKVDIFISPSHIVRDYFIKQGVPQEKIIYQKYGFNKDSITYKKREFTQQSKLRFAYMGRIIPSKGIKILCQAFSMLAQKYPHQKLQIYGSIGQNKRFLENENIEFKGGYDNNNIDAILQSIDVLIVPSIWLENAPLVIQEAFLAGVAVVASNIGGMEELIGGKRGFSFEAGNAESLQNLLEKIIQNPTLLNALPNNRDEVDSIQKDCQMLIENYNKLLKEKKC